jgi:hypothetical protein
MRSGTHGSAVTYSHLIAPPSEAFCSRWGQGLNDTLEGDGWIIDLIATRNQ